MVGFAFDAFSHAQTKSVTLKKNYTVIGITESRIPGSNLKLSAAHHAFKNSDSLHTKAVSQKDLKPWKYAVFQKPTKKYTCNMQPYSTKQHKQPQRFFRQ